MNNILNRIRRGRRAGSTASHGRADLHIHTSFSDGLSSPMQILDWVALHTPLNVIAVTDHDTMEGAWLAKRLAERYEMPFEVIIGLEITTGDGHLLALFMKEPVPSGLPVEESIARVHDQSGVCILPHPYSRKGVMNATSRFREYPELAYRLPLDGVESFNGAMLISRCNGLAAKLAHQLKKPSFAGSDAHIHHAVGSAITTFPGRTGTDLRKAIFSGAITAMGRHWSALAFFLTGFHWTLQQAPLPRIGLPSLRAT